MPSEPPITDLLEKLYRPDDAYTDIYQYFSKRAHEIAEARLSDKLRDRTSPSSIAQKALHESLTAAKSVGFPSREDFERLLTKHIKQALYDVNKEASRQKRDIDRQVPADPSTPPQGAALPPAVKAASNEFAVQYVDCLFKEETELRRMVVVLGIALEHSTSQVQRMIRTLPESADGVRSQSWIRKVINNRKQILADRLFRGDADAV